MRSAGFPKRLRLCGTCGAADRLTAPAVRLSESVGCARRKLGISRRHLRCGFQSQLGALAESLASAAGTCGAAFRVSWVRSPKAWHQPPAPAVRLSESVGCARRKLGISRRHLRCGFQSQLGALAKSSASAAGKFLGDLKGGFFQKAPLFRVSFWRFF